jgi:hypothetical protein
MIGKGNTGGITAELQIVLDDAVTAPFTIVNIDANGKDGAMITMANGTLEFTFCLMYEYMTKLHSFARKPGGKQQAQRMQEILDTYTPDQLKKMVNLVVGASHYDAQVSLNGGYINVVNCTTVHVIA